MTYSSMMKIRSRFMRNLKEWCKYCQKQKTCEYGSTHWNKEAYGIGTNPCARTVWASTIVELLKPTKKGGK